MNLRPIGIFDSGSGGLTVLSACRALLPNEDYVYASDSLGAWGGMQPGEILCRAEKCVDELIERGCKAVVAACNTATGVGIKAMRRDYALPFVGVEPAVKPAFRAFPRGKILVLCTAATAAQANLHALISKCDGADIVVRPQPELATLIENNLFSLETLREEAERIVREDSPDAVVLGCTHYVYIRYIFEEILGSERVFDGNDGTARRLRELLIRDGLLTSASARGKVTFVKIAR